MPINSFAVVAMLKFSMIGVTVISAGFDVVAVVPVGVVIGATTDTCHICSKINIFGLQL